jgi:hypothetical protein
MESGSRNSLRKKKKTIKSINNSRGSENITQLKTDFLEDRLNQNLAFEEGTSNVIEVDFSTSRPAYSVSENSRLCDLNKPSSTASINQISGQKFKVIYPNHSYIHNQTVEFTDDFTAHKELMYAILLDALKQLNGHHKKRGDRSEDIQSSIKEREITNWINTSNLDYVFSFDNVCEFLGIDPGYLREGLKRKY